MGLGDFKVTLPGGVQLEADKLIGVSGFSPDGTVSVPSDLTRTFRNLEPGRELDSEVKILEEIAKRIKNSGVTPTKTIDGNSIYENVEGTIKIFTERKPCESCEPLITQQWGKIFPKVKIVEVRHGPRYLPGRASDFNNEENFTSVLR